MYTALSEDGSMLNLFTIKDKQYLQSIRQSLFFCPECKGRLILKMGDKKITHFAHENREYCSGSGEAESFYHLKGKLDLYTKLNQLGLKPVLEPYYPEIRQRADIGFYYNNAHYVIEFQCAVISSTLLKKRTEGYKRANIVPIWILGFSNFKKWSPLKIRFSAFQFLFLAEYKEQYVLPAYCPYKQVFYFHLNPVPISVSQTFIASFSFPLGQIEEINSSPLALEKWTLSYWKDVIHQQKTHHLHYPTKHNDIFLKELYMKELHPHFLPPYIGVPARNGFIFETPPLFWQCYLFMDSFYSDTKNRIFPLQKIYEVFHRRIMRGDIRLRILPLLSTFDWKGIIHDYLQVLVKLNVLEEVKPSFFRLTVPHRKVYSYETQEQIEKEFYDHLKKYMIEESK